MTRACEVCSSEERLAVDRLIVQGANLAKLAKEYTFNYQSLYNHARHHVSRQLAEAWAKKELMASMDILAEIESLITRSKGILDEAESKGKLGIALKGIAEARAGYELLSRIAFSLHQVRLTELELERLRDGTAARERDEAFQESLKCLTFAELEVLQKLTRKLETQDPSITIFPDPPKPDWLTAKPAPRTRSERPEPPISPPPEPLPGEAPEELPKAAPKPPPSVEIPSSGGRYRTTLRRRRLFRELKRPV